MTDVDRFTQHVQDAQAKLDKARAKLNDAVEVHSTAAAELALACDRLDRAKDRVASLIGRAEENAAAQGFGTLGNLK